MNSTCPQTAYPCSPSHIISGIPGHPKSPVASLWVHWPLVRKPCLGLGRGPQPSQNHSLLCVYLRHSTGVATCDLSGVEALPSLKWKEAPLASPPQPALRRQRGSCPERLKSVRFIPPYSALEQFTAAYRTRLSRFCSSALETPFLMLPLLKNTL